MSKNYLLKLIVFALIFTNNTKEILAQQEILNEIVKEKLRLSQNDPLLDRSPSNFVGGSEIKLTDEINAEEGEPYLVINPNNTDNIVVSYMNFGTGALSFPVFYSFDAGENWVQSDFDTTEIFNDGSFPGFVIGGGGDPIFAFDNSGRLYFSWIYLGIDPITLEGRFLVYLASSDDGGITWDVADGDDKFIEQGGVDLSTGQFVLTDFGTGIFDRPWFDTDTTGGDNNGNLYVSGLFVSNSDPNESGLVVRRKLAGNNTFEEGRVLISTSANDQFGNIQVDGAGNVHITFADLTENLVMHSVSTDGGETFSNPTAIGLFSFDFNGADLVNDRENPAVNLAIDSSNNNLYVVWNSFEDDVQGFFSFSNDGGQNWSTPQNISALANMQEQQAYFPSVTSNSENDVSISWYALDENDAGHFMVFESTDGGLSWEDPVQISAEITEFQEYVDDEFFGDYYRSDRAGCISYSVWSDGRGLAGPKIYIGITDHCLLSVETIEISPNDVGLEVNALYPNPTRGELKVEFTIAEQRRIQVSLIDIHGRLVKQLEDDTYIVGSYLNTYTIDDLPSGIYFVSVESEKGRTTRKIEKL